MKNKRIIPTLLVVVTLVSTLFYSCTKDFILNEIEPTQSTSTSAQKIAVIGYPNVLNPYDYVGSRHNNVVKQLNQQYVNMGTEQMENAIISSTSDLVKQNYPNDEPKTDLTILNNISGFEGNWRDIDVASNYKQIIYATNTSENVKATISDFILEISNSASQMIS